MPNSKNRPRKRRQPQFCQRSRPRHLQHVRWTHWKRRWANHRDSRLGQRTAKSLISWLMGTKNFGIDIIVKKWWSFKNRIVVMAWTGSSRSWSRRGCCFLRKIGRWWWSRRVWICLYKESNYWRYISTKRRLSTKRSTTWWYQQLWIPKPKDWLKPVNSATKHHRHCRK